MAFNNKLTLFLRKFLRIFRRKTQKSSGILDQIPITKEYKPASKQDNALISSVIPDLIGDLQTKVQEQAYFTRANTLIAEFQGELTPVYNNVSDSEPIGYLNEYGELAYTKGYKEETKGEYLKRQVYKGYVIKYYNSEEIIQAKLRIDNRLDKNLPIIEYLTVDQQYELDKANEEGNILLEDDVEKLKYHPNYVKPPKIPRNTYVIGTDPIKEASLVEEIKKYQDKYDSNMRELYDNIKELRNQVDIDLEKQEKSEKSEE